MKRILPLLFLCSLLAACGGTGITGMRTEYMDSPLGVDVASPRFTWVFEKTAPEACAVAVATSPGGLDDPDMWLSPFTPDSPVVYGGEPLESHTRYYWKVVSRTGGKEHSSPAAWFETGKMSPSDWQAQWISDGQDKDHRPMPLLRREVEVSGTAASARLYVSGLGYYEMFINGEKVGDKMLDPGYTHFDKRAYYSTYDVTDMLKSGGNALCAALGNGWFNVQALSVWRFELARWRQRPRMICELHIEYADGTREVIASGDDWKTSTGALQFADLYSGEYYDARKEPAGWKNAGFDDAGWSAAQVVPSPAPLLQSELFPPIRITEQYAATGFKQFSPQLYVYSFPVNMSGVTRINIKGEAGTKVYIRHGELLHPDGHLDQSNIDPYFHREDNPLPLQPVEDEYFQTNIYVLRGDAAGEEYMPSFTYHGFQYVEVESDRPVTLTQESLTAQFMHTDLIPAGSFSCSNELLNKFYAATMQSYLSNWHSIPTDCPQREKNGWTADAWISMDLGLLSFDGVAIYEKWLRDFEDNTTPEGRVSGIIPSAGWGYADWIGPVWDAAMFIIPTALYDYYGDKRAIEH
ncbi:MAG: family 78 glycoside hydrolase catalytic domain, partial [Rikenellaceae bacterium]|nr:family 78 glycoside hydrolase catalytic domain [Rikenellaceae bacterium]